MDNMALLVISEFNTDSGGTVSETNSYFIKNLVQLTWMT